MLINSSSFQLHISQNMFIVIKWNVIVHVTWNQPKLFKKSSKSSVSAFFAFDFFFIFGESENILKGSSTGALFDEKLLFSNGLELSANGSLTSSNWDEVFAISKVSKGLRAAGGVETFFFDVLFREEVDFPFHLLFFLRMLKSKEATSSSSSSLSEKSKSKSSSPPPRSISSSKILFFFFAFFGLFN